jgi:hypothetical protein
LIGMSVVGAVMETLAVVSTAAIGMLVSLSLTSRLHVFGDRVRRSTRLEDWLKRSWRSTDVPLARAQLEPGPLGQSHDAVQTLVQLILKLGFELTDTPSDERIVLARTRSGTSTGVLVVGLHQALFIADGRQTLNAAVGSKDAHWLHDSAWLVAKVLVRLGAGERGVVERRLLSAGCARQLAPREADAEFRSRWWAEPPVP